MLFECVCVCVRVQLGEWGLIESALSDQIEQKVLYQYQTGVSPFSKLDFIYS